MGFNEFKALFQEHVYKTIGLAQNLFIAEIDWGVLWDTYLDSFPEGQDGGLYDR